MRSMGGRRLRRGMLAFLVAMIAGACGGGGSSAATPARTGSSPTESASPSSSPAADPLVGNWDTGPYSSKDYGGSKFEFNVRFYDEGGVPYVVMTGWDPTKGTMPQDGDHGPYKLLANNRLAIASIDDPSIATIYSYKLSGDELILTWIRNDPDAPPGDIGGPFTTIHLSRA